MKDIDFDELDKAVNSLMAGVPKNQAQSDPVEKTVDIPTTEASQALVTPNIPAEPPVSDAVAVKSSEPPTSPSLQTAPASRRGGRFMDVVHPSSNMKKPETPRSISRQGATIAPRPSANTTPLSTPLTQTTPVSEPVATPSVPIAPSTETPPPKSDWPDPLEVAGFSEKDTDITTSSKPAEEMTEVKSDEKPETPERAVEPPLTSPFLPDTKVEKRPLGGNVSEELPKEELKDDEKDFPVIINDDDQLPATADDVKPVLPAELHSDLVAIESDAATEKTGDDQKSDMTTPSPEPPHSVPMAKSEEKPKEPVVPSGPASIPQQYREEPSSGDQKNGAIYDTANYHQPLAHPAKQKSGWMWIVWILLILIIGAGGGAALYFFRIV